MKIHRHLFLSRLLPALCLLTLWSVQVFSQNIIASYDPDTPTWSHEIQWGNVIDMGAYTNGETDFEKFENARDELHAQGGGVLYYPAGEYAFPEVGNNSPEGRGLMLKSGVVIAGETPTDTDVTDGQLALPTKFIFSFEEKTEEPLYGAGEVPYAWNMIGIVPSEGEALSEVKNVGIAWVELHGATIYFGLDANWGGTYATSGAWYSGRASTGIWKDRVPDGTHPIDVFAGYSSSGNEYKGAGSNRFVLGCEIKDATVHNPKIIDYSQGGDFKFYNYKFGSRIAIYGSNVYVANNVLPKSSKNFLYNQVTAITQQDRCNQVFGTHESILLYDYGKAFGIDINKTFLNVFPNKAEGYFEENVVIKNNFIYNHGAKGVDISGKWMTIRNNHNERDYLNEGDDVYGLIGSEEYELTVDGYFESVLGGNGCLSDNQSRAFDMAGEAIWLDRNTWNNLGSNPGNDGESILCQRHGGTDIHSWALTRNSHLDSYNLSNKGYLSGFDVHNQGMLVAWNKTLGTVGNLKAGDLYDCAFIPNGEETFLIDYTIGERDFINNCPEGAVSPPSQVLIEWSEDDSYAEISWIDATANEIGYRVDKRAVGAESWQTIAYRPRQSTGHARNEPRWKDFSADRTQETEYRVVALNCDDNQEGASVWVNALEELEAPSIEKSHGSIYHDSIRIDMAVVNIGADIYYTLDGSDPDQSSTWFTDPFYVKESASIRAKTYKGNLEPSSITEAEVVQLEAPFIGSCAEEEHQDPLAVTITADAATSEIRYSFENEDVSQGDFLYQDPLQIGGEAVLYAKAFGEGVLPSSVASCQFKFFILSLDEESTFNIYPNPANGSVYLDLAGFEGQLLEIHLLNVNGKRMKEIKSFRPDQREIVLRVSDIKPGLYFLRVINSEKEVVTRKVVIR